VSYKTIYAWACEHPSKPAVIHNGTTISYSAFANAIGATFDYLDVQDLPEGHNVVVIIHNLLDCWVAVLALQAIGLNTICIRTTELIETLGLKNVVGIVTTEYEIPKHQLDSDTESHGRVIAIHNPDYGSEELSGILALRESTNVGGHILYTSGTTGTYKKLFFSAELQKRREAERVENGSYTADTFCHCTNFGLWTAVGYKTPLGVWLAKGCIIVDQRPDWHQYFLESGVTKAFLIPDQVNQLLGSLEEQPALSSPMDFNLTVTAGFLSRKFAEQILNRVATNLVNGYGFTETNIGGLRSAVTDLEDLYWLSPNEYRTVEIVDEAGSLCPFDEEGEFRIRLTELDCSAYMDHPEASKKAFRDGCFYPGDMAVQRADGRIRILGRSVDVLNFRGQKLAVAPMEEKIQTLLGVSAVCLFSGLSSTGEEEVVIAFESEQWPDKSDLNYVGHEFAQFDQVRFAVIHPFPRTQTGTSKIDRIALRKLIFPVE
jgi:acyl-coenzyme A synthetase/AMP-(fatty) acid ligase